MEGLQSDLAACYQAPGSDLVTVRDIADGVQERHSLRLFRRPGALAVDAFGAARGDILRIHWLPGHNHLSPAGAL